MNSGVDEPPGVQNFSRCPARMPPASSSSSRSVVPSGASYWPGRVTWPGQREDARTPWTARCRRRRTPAAPCSQDVGHGGDRLDVVDHRRARVQARHGGERRLEPGLAAVALQRVQQRRLLAADVGAGAGVHHDVQAEPGALDVAAQVARLVGLGHGVVQPPDHVQDLAADVDEGLLGPDRVGGDDDALDQRLRVGQQRRHVLAGAGLGLVGVDHQVVRLAVALRDEAPLHAGREARPAAAAQHRVLERLDDAVGLHGQRRGQRLVPAVRR